MDWDRNSRARISPCFSSETFQLKLLSLTRIALKKLCLNFSNEEGGGWSTDGCRLASRDNGSVTCECDHLTNFAVLMDMSGISTVSKSCFL